MSTEDRDRREDRLIKTANRLRQMRAELADESDQVRKDRLSEELGEVLAAVPSADRDEFTRSLLELLLAGDFAAPLETERPEVETAPAACPRAV